MKKMILLLAVFGMMTTASFAQGKHTNRTKSRLHTASPSEPLAPTVPAENKLEEEKPMEGSGTPGIDGSTNDKDHSGDNKSSSFESNNPQPTISYPGNNQPAINNKTTK